MKSKSCNGERESKMLKRKAANIFDADDDYKQFH